MATLPREAGADASIFPRPAEEPAWTVQKALADLPGAHGQPAEATESPVPFFHLLELLKTTKRKGWRNHGILQGESVADHMYRMSILAMFAPPGLDLNKCIKLCLVHDLAESIVGNLTPADNVNKLEKNRREALTMAYIQENLLGLVNAGETGKMISALWEEFEMGTTPESRFAQDLDKVELLLQMVEYETRGQGKLNLAEFTYVSTKLKLPETQKWAQEILEEQRRFWAEHVGDVGNAAAPQNQTTREQQDQYYK